MKKLSLIAFVFSLLLVSCSSSSEDPQVESAEDLEKMYDEIIEISLINSKPCTNPDEWGFISINSSACDVHPGFIPYSKTNASLFLSKVKKYQDAKVAYEAKMNIVRLCDMIVAPSGVGCVDGKPVLTYGPVVH